MLRVWVRGLNVGCRGDQSQMCEKRVHSWGVGIESLEFEVWSEVVGREVEHRHVILLREHLI